jgi:hypothetical protein
MIYVSLALKLIVTAEEIDAALGAKNISSGYFDILLLTDLLAGILWNLFFFQTGVKSSDSRQESSTELLIIVNDP